MTALICPTGNGCHFHFSLWSNGENVVRAWCRRRASRSRPVRLGLPVHPPDPDSGRIEDRTVDGSCNPYRAATAMLAAGLDGIERGLDAGEPNSANLYELSDARREELGIELLPANLLDAVRELDEHDVLRAAFGKTRDGHYIDYYAKVKRREWQAAHEQITQWELGRYLQLF